MTKKQRSHGIDRHDTPLKLNFKIIWNFKLNLMLTILMKKLYSLVNF